MRLPEFSIDDYRQLLVDFAGAGYSFAPVTTMPAPVTAPVVYVRHDVDFDPRSVWPIAELEADLGIRATYYVLLTQHYNPLQADNRRAIRRLAEAGHEIGLHYDMEVYSADGTPPAEHFQREIDILSDLAGAPVATVSMHQPCRGAPDPFLRLEGFVHPHDPRLQEGLVYVSDSCRGWRDTTLLHCMNGSRPDRVLLNTHAELWLDGSIRDRMAYLDFLAEQVSGHYRDFMDTVVRQSWLAHPAPRLHDEREARHVRTC